MSITNRIMAALMLAVAASTVTLFWASENINPTYLTRYQTWVRDVSSAVRLQIDGKAPVQKSPRRG